MELLFTSLFVDCIDMVWIINAYFEDDCLIHEVMCVETGAVWTTNQAFSINEVCHCIEAGNFDNGE